MYVGSMGALKRHPKGVDVEGLRESKIIFEICPQDILDFRGGKGFVRDGSKYVVVGQVHIACS